MRYLRVLIGLALLPLAWHLHGKAMVLEDIAMEAPYTVDNPCPKGQEGDFFRRPARVAMKEPENQQRLAAAIWIDRGGMLCCLASLVLVTSALLPRRKPQQEEVCDSAGPS